MKTAALIARIVLGFVFLVFGLNGFLQFLPQPAMPQGAVSFFSALAASGYMVPQLSASDAGSTERSSGYGSDAIENSQQGTLSSRAP